MRSYRSGRLCGHGACETILSVYNPSQYCAVHVYLATPRKRTTPRPINEVACPLCGTTFETANPARKFCSDRCRLAAFARRKRAAQRQHWSGVLAARADRYGLEPSAPGRWAAALFQERGARDVLELGAGQGRDSVHFARLGMDVRALDFAESGAEAIRAKAAGPALAGSLQAAVHDCCEPLPFPDASFDACYSHMLFCMALTTPQLEQLSAEVRRVLRSGGLHVYTARTTADPDYGAGVAHGDDRYESNGFVVHFFSRELVQRLAAGYELLEVAEFEEGALPRRLFRVTLRKEAA